MSINGRRSSNVRIVSVRWEQGVAWSVNSNETISQCWDCSRLSVGDIHWCTLFGTVTIKVEHLTPKRHSKPWALVKKKNKKSFVLGFARRMDWKCRTLPWFYIRPVITHKIFNHYPNQPKPNQTKPSIQQKSPVLLIFLYLGSLPYFILDFLPITSPVASRSTPGNNYSYS